MESRPEHRTRLVPLLEEIQDTLNLDTSNPINATAWFLGPKAENAAALRDLINMAMDGQINSRIAYSADDPSLFHGEPEGHAESVDIIREELGKLITKLNGSIPLASYRNQSHMYWDLTLPGVVGYFAAMLYNQNNVAAEASPVTTILELEVAKDMCRMLGFPVAEDDEEMKSWGHITCDGSIANGEAVWAARNLKYLPVALAAAIATDDDLERARSVIVQTCTGRHARLIDMSSWELLNLPVDVVIDLVETIEHQSGIEGEIIRRAVDTHSVQNTGMARFAERYLDNSTQAEPVVLAPATAHYSWPKSTALAGLGTQAFRPIEVDSRGRMKMTSLRQALNECLEKQQPVMQLVMVLGSTAEGAIDPLADAVQMRREFQDLGLDFPIHVDGAWGGYFTAMLRPPKDIGSGDTAEIIDQYPELYLNDYFQTHFEAIADADSITLDPHKSGFIPYPAGSICYRNGNMRNLIAFLSPVVSHGGVDVTVGQYGIEGSKPGAAPAAVYLSHKVIPLDQDGYGRMLGRCLFNSKRFYASLVCMDLPSAADQDSPVKLVPFQQLPAEQQGGDEKAICAQKEFIREHFVDNSTRALIEDEFGLARDNPTDVQKEAFELFRSIGSDLSIVSYAFNFKTKEGWNTRLDRMNELNDAVFRKLSLQPGVSGKVPDVEMFITSSAYDAQHYGKKFVENFAARAGVRLVEDTPITFLISTTQNPWLSNTSDENVMIGKLINILRKTVRKEAEAIIKKYNID